MREGYGSCPVCDKLDFKTGDFRKSTFAHIYGSPSFAFSVKCSFNVYVCSCVFNASTPKNCV